MTKWYYQIKLLTSTSEEGQVKGKLLAALGPYSQYAVVPKADQWLVIAVVHGQAVWDGQVKQVAGEDAFGQETLLGS